MHWPPFACTSVLKSETEWPLKTYFLFIHYVTCGFTFRISVMQTLVWSEAICTLIVGMVFEESSIWFVITVLHSKLWQLCKHYTVLDPLWFHIWLIFMFRGRCESERSSCVKMDGLRLTVQVFKMVGKYWSLNELGKVSLFNTCKFQFRWLKIKGIYIAFPISITLFSTILTRPPLVGKYEPAHFLVPIQDRPPSLTIHGPCIYPFPKWTWHFQVDLYVLLNCRSKSSSCLGEKNRI